jgi:hypothetical protein
MKDTLLLLSSFAGGLFLGYLTAILAFFVWGLVKEGFEAPKQMAIPAIFLLGIFGTALAYLTVFVFQSWPIFMGAAITFAHGARPLFRSEDANDQTQSP